MSSNSDYSSHCGTPEPLITPLSSPHPWQNDPAFGIVHSTGCKTCRDFMGHAVTASQNHETTFQEAVKERDRQITVRFLDGVREGRRIQRDRDLERLTRCRSERNQAFDLNTEYRSRLLALEEELRDTKDRLLMLQIAYGEVSHVDHPFISDGEDSNSEGFSTVEMQSVLFASSISDGSPGLHSAEHTELLEPIPLQIPAPGATSDLDTHDTDGSQSDVPAVVCVSSTISGDWSCARQYPESRSPSPAGSHNNISSSDDEALAESSSNDSSASSSSSSAASVSLSLIPYSASSPEDDDDPQDLETLKALMAAAHDPNNTRELDRVRALCTRAHRTTHVQQSAPTD
ncbi:hypothetical protein BDQ17DRAFT_510342 [Cyathus striatus]|nr:hypothetical protein BDQ17DRAFT_510342 [Cyathus striatus]